MGVSYPSTSGRRPQAPGAGDLVPFSPTASIHLLYHWLARSPLVARVASLARNQLDAVIRYHFADSFYHADESDERLLALLGPSLSTFIDVGANVGRWSATLLKHAPASRGVLLEPGSIAAKAKQAVAGFPAVTVVVAAAGEREGTVTFYESAGTSEGSTVVEGVRLSDAIARSVPMVTIDSELNRLGWDGLDLLKVDAEGFDLDVLRGGARAIHRRAIRWIQFEYNVHWRVRGSTLLAAARLLDGYELFISLPDGLHRANLDRYGDYFAYSNYFAARADSLDVLAPLIRRPL